MKKEYFTLLILLNLISQTLGLPIQDEVVDLPKMPDLSFDLYSGYLPINSTDHFLFYISAQSQRDPSTDPIIIWFNGGPGCSSMFGFAIENGPYIMDDGADRFKKNTYSWNKEATVVYIDAPASVDYSLCSINCDFNDLNTAQENLIAILNFFTMKFPEFRSNDLYIAGESYGGIYIPYLVREIHNHNQNASDEERLNLKGFIIGNPAVNFKYDTLPAFVELAFQMSIIDDRIYSNIKTTCTPMEMSYLVLNRVNDINTVCLNNLIQFYDAIGKLNRYDIFGKCYQPPKEEDNESPKIYSANKGLFLTDIKANKKHKDFFTMDQYTRWAEPDLKKLEQISGRRLRAGAQCAYRLPAAQYFNDEYVKKQLHVSEQINEWEFCNDNIRYTIDYGGSQQIFEQLEHQYRMLIFSGDADGVCPTIGTMQWIRDLDWIITKDWAPYFYNRQVAGYYEERGNLTFATVHGAGHMAPQLRKGETYNLVFKWINDQPL